MESTLLAVIVFGLSLVATFAAAWYARFKSAASGLDEDLAGRGLNRWLVGLSAATTGNSGFIVTGAVGLGYAGGMQWVLLPLSWLIGDLVFWRFFPGRLNSLARRANATTLSELLTFDLAGTAAKVVSVAVSLVLIVFLSTYTAAQWLAGKKFLSGVFELSDFSALLLFAATIVAYSSLGGFRGSVYADFVQSIIRIVGTLVALIAVGWYAVADSPGFSQNISSAGNHFFSLFPSGTLVTTIGFVSGFAFAAIGFGLGQPQIVSRYFAGGSPKETQSAQWIYIGFLQFTWIAMTIFGVVLRGVMPGLEDPETGLSHFFQKNIGAIATGIIIADIYATIASTSNGILIAIAQTLQRDILSKVMGIRLSDVSYKTAIIFVLGVATIVLSFVLPGSVFTIALSSISKIGAGIAGPMMIKALGWRHTSLSLLAAIFTGICASFIWSWHGLSGAFNEAGIGLVCSLLFNWMVVAMTVPRQKWTSNGFMDT